MTDLRIGYGYDVHRLVSGRALVLGGVTVPFEKGLLGHSDADVLTHAVMDALLGAAALGDIGKLFPDSDACYAGADSTALLGLDHCECGRYGGGAGAEAGALYPGDAGETGGGHGTGRGTRFCEGDDGGGAGIYRQRRGHSGPRGGAGGENGVKNPVQSSHIINSGGVVPKVNIWYNISVKMRRRVCPIRTDAPLFGIGYGGRGKEGRLEPQDYSGRAGETA